MDRLVSLALICGEAENEEYEGRSKRKEFWVHEISLLHRGPVSPTSVKNTANMS